MRILDIGVAHGYALLCLALVSYDEPLRLWGRGGPGPLPAEGERSLFHYLGSTGLVFLAAASPSQVCASLRAYSNSTMFLGGQIGGTPLPGCTEQFLAESTVTFSLSRQEGLDPGMVRRAVAATLVSVIVFTAMLLANSAVFAAENSVLKTTVVSSAQLREQSVR